MEFKGRSNIKIINGDCMDYLKDMKENQFDLAIVDPPYGIGISKNPFRQKHKKQNWDNAVPSKEYFNSLKKVSKNQIIWGGNYFNLEPTQGFLIWDKKQPFDFSSAMCEYAWMSLQKPAKIFNKHVVTAENNKIHPTQKPVQLYKWLLQNYAKEGDTILDTHGGSMSIALACWDLGFDLTVFEIDTDYYNDAIKRIENHIQQVQMYPPEETKQEIKQQSIFDAIE